MRREVEKERAQAEIESDEQR